MTHSSTLSIIFGVLLLICLPFILTEVEKEPDVETEQPVHYTECQESERDFRHRLIVCNASGIKWYHYTGEVDSVVYNEIERIWRELE